jgi:hypothetical protein
MQFNLGPEFALISSSKAILFIALSVGYSNEEFPLLHLMVLQIHSLSYFTSILQGQMHK